MSPTRRTVLVGSAGVLVGIAASGCGFPTRRRPGAATRTFPSSKTVIGHLRELVDEVGRDAFQQVVVYPEPDAGPNVSLLTADGGVQSYGYRDGWTKGRYQKKALSVSPSSSRLAKLPLDRLADYVKATGPDVRRVAFRVDYVGRVRAIGYTQAFEPTGLKADGSGPVPKVDPDDAGAVKRAVAEIVRDYGRDADRVGALYGAVQVDANVAGSKVGLRIVREPTLAAEAAVTRQTPFDPRRLFDPTTAVERKKTIATDAGVKGKVWDWQYTRPPKGGEPLVSYGIGTRGPDTRVWLHPDGTIAAVVKDGCIDGSRFCPG